MIASVSSRLNSPPRRALPRGPRAPGFVQTIRYGLNPYGFFSRAQKRFGSEFTVRLMGETWVILTEPSAVREVFNQRPDSVDAGAANGPLRTIIGTRNVFFLDDAEHIHRRKIVARPLHGEALRLHHDTISELVARQLDLWPIGTPFPAWNSLRQITFGVSFEVVFGDSDRKDTAELRRCLWETLNWAIGLPRAAAFVLGGPDLVMKLPGYARRLEILDRAVYAEIHRRRREGLNGSESDALSQILSSTDESGEPIADQDIRDDVVALVLTGAETTTSLLAWALHELARSEDLQDRIRDGEPGICDAVIAETLRLHSPATIVSMRKLRNARSFGGAMLPEGAVVALTPVVIHRREDLFDRPEEFIPDRFLHAKPSAGDWLPFGGGARRCVGASLAQLEAQLVIEALVERFDMMSDRPEPEGLARRGFVAVPRRGARIVVQDRVASDQAAHTHEHAAACPVH